MNQSDIARKIIKENVERNEKSTETIGIHFGALCKPIKIQLEEQGYTLPDEDNARFEKIRTAITLLYLQNIIPDGVHHKANMKLLKKIIKTVIPKEK
jgi:hypothetical protein